jgi:hypothetical protein
MLLPRNKMNGRDRVEIPTRSRILSYRGTYQQDLVGYVVRTRSTAYIYMRQLTAADSLARRTMG